jgi:hypothetical protein
MGGRGSGNHRKRERGLGFLGLGDTIGGWAPLWVEGVVVTRMSG